MLPDHATSPQAPERKISVGVGIDTARYGHYAAFLRDDLQPAAAELAFVESADGYALLRQRLQQIADQHNGAVCFHIHLDAAGQYADNLLHFVHTLASAFTLRVSAGDPQRNKNYRAAFFAGKKSDPIEARAMARFAVKEKPAPAAPMPIKLRVLRKIASRLHAVVRQRTRLVNQFHQLLALSFPELALIVKDISVGWVLELCSRYPTAKLLAQADISTLETIPYMPHERIDALLARARASVASLDDDAIAELVRDQVRQLRDVRLRQKRLENLLVAAYRQLPEPNHIDTIKGIGEVTAAVLTAFILDIERFDAPDQLVKYFGVLPIEVASGVDRDGNPRGPKRYVMSKRGNDLVRRYLWMAALSAVTHNPAVRALYARVVQKNPKRKAIAIGHAMRKLLHLVFAIWKTKQPFDKNHYAWDTPAHVEAPAEKNQTAGLTQTAEPAQKEVTAACADNLAQSEPVDEHTFIDFAHLKQQLPLARVLDHLGLSPRLRGTTAQKRCACPIHRGDGRGRTFSVNLDANVFQCFEAKCAKKGDVIDLWAALHQQDLRQAALELVRTFALEPAARTEKRHG
jgi:transposase